ncbi:MAG: hypothetical protein V1838_01310 [Patescibacteria group bacterium]
MLEIITHLIAAAIIIGEFSWLGIRLLSGRVVKYQMRNLLIGPWIAMTIEMSINFSSLFGDKFLNNIILGSGVIILLTALVFVYIYLVQIVILNVPAAQVHEHIYKFLQRASYKVVKEKDGLYSIPQAKVKIKISAQQTAAQITFTGSMNKKPIAAELFSFLSQALVGKRSAKTTSQGVRVMLVSIIILAFLGYVGYILLVQDDQSTPTIDRQAKKAECEDQGGIYSSVGTPGVSDTFCNPKAEDASHTCSNSSECTSGLCFAYLTDEQKSTYAAGNLVTQAGECGFFRWPRGAYYTIENGRVADYINISYEDYLPNLPIDN